MLVAVLAGTVFTVRSNPLSAESEQAPAAATTVTVPEIAFDSDTRFLKYSPDMNLGEVLGIAVNSKGRIVVLNHPGSATAPRRHPEDRGTERDELRSKGHFRTAHAHRSSRAGLHRRRSGSPLPRGKWAAWRGSMETPFASMINGFKLEREEVANLLFCCGSRT